MQTVQTTVLDDMWLESRRVIVRVPSSPSNLLRLTGHLDHSRLGCVDL